ncbi:phage holin family protein [Microtetraspora sp. NBRC 16547]|uniref:phage holin family protein n=1 Tax=Microtetraspora sp. NBRC 16547 TaxID=3030993 RepID=UPI0024A30E62|nr:phage holin family protein [Microtetraspora sp. NBRC 16547]GLW96829.1 membrane protein [Microtetraspora sp. NBRC 16547]
MVHTREARETKETRSTGELVRQMSEQVSRLVRDELRLARIELTEKGRRAGLGAGLVGGAGAIALLGGGALTAAAILALALVLPGWAAALIIGGALLFLAMVLGVVGKQQVTAAAPTARRTMQSVKTDIGVLREGVRR